MPYSATSAFSAFRKDTIDLDPTDTVTARTSRDFLFTQLQSRAANAPTFPALYGDFMSYGSFARNTKIQPLDDIDLLLFLHACGATCAPTPFTMYQYRVWPRYVPCGLSGFLDDDGYVSSIRVLNKIRDSLGLVPQYEHAQRNRHHEAVTLKLLSYEWVYDIVPAYKVSDNYVGVAHYLIPDGSGHWKRTDPRIDQKNVTQVNQWYHGKLLPIVRMLKYWNGLTAKPVLSSYYFETLVLGIFNNGPSFVDLKHAIEYFFRIFATHVMLPCPDPKGLGSNLDADETYERKQNIATAASIAAGNARMAMQFEAEGDDEEAITWWRFVFGQEFPAYGS